MEVHKPTGSYYITLPDDIQENIDDEVTSFWVKGSNLALQISSHVRFEGKQVGARTRLKRRLARDSVTAKYVSLGPPHTDHAAASFVDEKGLQWFYVYVTWPDLAIFVTILGPPEELADRDHWAFEAVRSLKHV